jgi:membrane complex biogenesis BtpA family protein
MTHALDMFGVPKPVIGMLHAPAFPGSPRNAMDLNSIVDWVLRDAEALSAGGADGLLLENFGDVPFYPQRVPPHVVAFMTAVAGEVRRAFDLPLGINILRNDAMGALAVAAASRAQFIRVNVYTGARITDQGLIQSDAHKAIRYRKLLDLDVKILADVDVKHSAPLAVRSLGEEVEEVISRGCADGVIVTGSATGRPTDPSQLQIAKDAAAGAAVIAGSGVDLTNVASVLEAADGLIVGTAFKRSSLTVNPVDPDRVRTFMDAVRQIRTTSGGDAAT